MKDWEKVIVEGAIALLVRAHAQLCRDCKKKYNEIEKHMRESADNAKKEANRTNR